MPNPIKDPIRIESDGRGFDTHIYLADGTEISHLVRAITWHIDAGGAAEITLKIAPFASLDIKGKLKALIEMEDDKETPCVS